MQTRAFAVLTIVLGLACAGEPRSGVVACRLDDDCARAGAPRHCRLTVTGGSQRYCVADARELAEEPQQPSAAGGASASPTKTARDAGMTDASTPRDAGGPTPDAALPVDAGREPPSPEPESDAGPTTFCEAMRLQHGTKLVRCNDFAEGTLLAPSFFCPNLCPTQHVIAEAGTENYVFESRVALDTPDAKSEVGCGVPLHGLPHEIGFKYAGLEPATDIDATIAKLWTEDDGGRVLMRVITAKGGAELAVTRGAPGMEEIVDSAFFPLDPAGDFVELRLRVTPAAAPALGLLEVLIGAEPTPRASIMLALTEAITPHIGLQRGGAVLSARYDDFYVLQLPAAR